MIYIYKKIKKIKKINASFTLVFLIPFIMIFSLMFIVEENIISSTFNSREQQLLLEQTNSVCFFNNDVSLVKEEVKESIINENTTNDSSTTILIVFAIIFVLSGVLIIYFLLKTKKNNKYVNSVMKEEQFVFVDFLDSEEYFDRQFYYYACDFLGISYEYKKNELEKAFLKQINSRMTNETKDELLIVYAYLNSFY